MTETPASESNASVASNSLKIMFVQGLGLCLGLIFDITIAAMFGANRQMDAIFAASTIPQMFVSVIISISLRVFAPVFTEAFGEGGELRLRSMFSGVLNFSILFWVAIGALAYIGAELIILLQTPGFDSAARTLSVVSFRILLLNLIAIGIVEPIRAYLVYKNQLILASTANFFRFFASLVVLFTLTTSLGIFAIPWAYVAGGAIQVLIFGAAFLLLGGRYRLTFGQDVDTWGTIKSRFGPPFFGEVIGHTGVVIERVFASFLPPGALSALGYGRRVLVALNGLINQSVSVAILPRVSREAITNQLDKLRQSIVFSTKLLTLGTGLSAVLIIGFSQIIIRILFQRGAFDLTAAEATSTVLVLYTPSIIFIGITQLYLIPFYAFGETRIVLHLRILFLVINIGLDFVLFYFFKGPGLAAAYTLSAILINVAAGRALSKRVGNFRKDLAVFFTRLTLALVLVGAVIYLGRDRIAVGESSVVMILQGAFLALIAIVLFGVLVILLGLIPPKSIRSIFPGTR